MTTYSGREAICAGCSVAIWVAGGLSDLGREARAAGWERVAGRWHCDRCLTAARAAS